MSLRLRALRLVARTEDGDFGREIAFDNGLVVLRAENSMGKSTAVNSMLYALGMEGLIDQRHQVPLPAAMTTQLQAPDDRVLAVAESRVLLEIENALGETATLERSAKRPVGDTRTVRVWDGRRVTAPTEDDTYRDMLARVVGSGTGELAIGRWLEEFLGWDLPAIVMPDGGERRLYPELLLSLILVEQRTGWRGIQAGMPTYGIPDARKRAREYLLGLTVYARQRRRLELNRDAEQIRQAWRSALAVARAAITPSGLRLEAPADVDTDFGDEAPLRAVDLRTNRTLDDERSAVARELAGGADTPDTQRAENTLTADERRLRDLEAQLQTAMLDLRQRQGSLTRLRHELTALDKQRAHLQDDLRRNRDAQRLQKFGGEPWASDDRECPTCHQELPPTLLGTLTRPTMTVEQNIGYVDQQLQVVDAAGARANAEIESTGLVQTAARQAISDMRAEIRALRDALVRARGVPSAADIQRRLIVERRLGELEAVATELGALRNELSQIAARARENQAALAALPTAGLTAEDEATLGALEGSFLEQLHLYRPESLPVGELGISRDSYLPVAGNVDLGFQISASDGIRLIWAYLLGMLETARSRDTNHPGLVVFDEPRQQSAREESLRRLLERAARARDAGQQVIFATSEPRDRLEPMLEHLPVQYLPVEGRLLVPM
jgi:hypothetical protein